jgi:predicted  nucleic acid-binding Zn-ribbon protein
MRSAQSQILAAEAVLAEEFIEGLHTQLAAALAEADHAKEQMKAVGARLVEARTQAEPLWAQKARVEKAIFDLDTALDAASREMNYPDYLKPESYEAQRRALTNLLRWLTDEIRPLSDTIAGAEDQLRHWTVAHGRAQVGVHDCRQAIADKERLKRF